MVDDKTSLEDVLRWASQKLGDRLTFATGFGAEGCVIIDAIGRAKLPIDLFTLDTGVLFPETYELWHQLEARYGVTIRAVRPPRSIAEQADDHGPRLWEREPDRCCDLRKVGPLREALAGFGGWITAIRREHTPERATAQVVEQDAKFGLVKVNPLVAWTHDDVWARIYANDVPYNPLHERGYPSIGCMPCTSVVQIGENPRSGRWRGSAKRECGLHLTADAEEKSA
ncbi:MAG: phosphoadenylyl-sulfate reductase [Proteobacteria bacterium]|nr:phosphoadenylyl-sulfate reductase [Pseudomonadota bacterium]